MISFDNLEEKTINNKQVFSGKLLHVYDDDVLLPNNEEGTREYVMHVGAVAVVPVTDDGNVIIERQFRYPMHKVITEIPAGKLDSKSEDRLEAAKRELREETGITADTWINIGEYYPAAAYSDEIITMYIAKDLHMGGQKLDEDEFLNIEEVPLSKLVQEVMDGSIQDGKSQVALLKAYYLLNC